MNKTLTIKQLAEAIQEDYLVTSALVKFLVNKGIVKEVGKETRPEGARGKPGLLYEVPNEVELVFWEDVGTVETVEPTPETVTEKAPGIPA